MFKLIKFFIKFSINLIGFTLIIQLFNILSLYNELNLEMPKKLKYDYIIVGAGTAGTTIFNKLISSDKNLEILLIDAGTLPFTIMDIPILTPLLHQTKFNWNYETVPQKYSCKSMQNQKSKWSSGKGFGGSNILNNMISNWCHPEDYRGWFNKPENYNYQRDILPYFLDNDITINNIENFTKFAEAILNNAGNYNDVIFKRPKLYQKNGWRWTMAHEAYMKYYINKQQQQNFEIAFSALVTNIIFSPDVNVEKGQKEKEEGGSGVRLRAIGIRLMKSGKIRKIKARKGVILSAGTIGTAKILMQSGIGLCDELSLLNITCRKNLPVGRNLQDHIATGLDLIKLNTNLHMEPINLLSPIALRDYLLYGRGLYSFGGCELYGYLKKDANNTIPPDLGFMIIPAGITADNGVILRDIVNINQHTWNEYFLNILNDGYETISILPILLHPKSRGVVKLNTTDPFGSPPYIDPQYLHNDDDIRVLIKGLKYIDEFIQRTEFYEFNGEIYNKLYPGCEQFTFKSNSYWECYVRHLTLTIYHPVGTCRMGDPLDSRTVVDQRNYNVKGVENLYVVDASIIPEIPSGNPNAIVAMLAKRFLSLVVMKDYDDDDDDYDDDDDDDSFRGKTLNNNIYYKDEL